MAGGSQLEIVKGKGEKSDRDWGSLPTDILHTILDHHLCIADCVRIAGVCSLWRATVPPELRPFPKLLLLASTPSANLDGSSRNLFTADRKPLLQGGPRIKLPLAFEKRCCGSCFGWLAFATDRRFMKRRKVISLGVTLLNPFTGATIRLPPIFMTDWDNFRDEQEYVVSKVVLSADPATAPDTFEAVALYGGMHNLAYYKPGAGRWARVARETWIQLRAGSNVLLYCYDVLHYRGKFYGLFGRGRVVTIQPGDSLTMKIVVPRRSGDKGSLKEFIVESSTGDLLVAQLWGYRSMEWKIFKVIDSCGRRCDHEKVKSLGDDAIFVGSSRSLALQVPASEAGRGLLPGCRPNCIYYTDDD